MRGAQPGPLRAVVAGGREDYASSVAALCALDVTRLVRRSIPLNAAVKSSPTGTNDRTPNVVIVGGGFAGLNAAKTLRHAPVRITLIDRRNHHLFQPLLYQVATAVLSPSDVAQPIRGILRKQRNTEVLMEEATGFDLGARTVFTTGGAIPYDYLIVAAGATHSYFGNDQWEPYAPGLKTLENALDIRARVLKAFEDAEKTDDPVRRAALMTFIVVGAGPTGVELAGAIAEIANHTLVRDFHRIDTRQARIILVEALDRVLPPFPPDLSAKALTALHQMGVEPRFGNPVKEIRPGVVRIGDEDVPCETVLWAAGVKASPLGKELGVEVDRAGRAPVQPDLSIAGHPEVFVAGDLASLRVGDKPVPGVAPAAMQMGRHAALNVARLVNGKPAVPFVYRDKGSMAIVGRNKAVAQIGSIKYTGFLAWASWLVIHLGYLNGFRNRLIALINWVAMYLTFNRGARLISGESGWERAMARQEAAALLAASSRNVAADAALAANGANAGTPMPAAAASGR